MPYCSSYYSNTPKIISPTMISKYNGNSVLENNALKKQYFPQQYLLDSDKIKHLEFIQSNIARMNQCSFQMKGTLIHFITIHDLKISFPQFYLLYHISDKNTRRILFESENQAKLATML